MVRPWLPARASAKRAKWGLLMRSQAARDLRGLCEGDLGASFETLLGAAYLVFDGFAESPGRPSRSPLATAFDSFCGSLGATLVPAVCHRATPRLSPVRVRNPPLIRRTWYFVGLHSVLLTNRSKARRVRGPLFGLRSTSVVCRAKASVHSIQPDRSIGGYVVDPALKPEIAHQPPKAYSWPCNTQSR